MPAHSFQPFVSLATFLKIPLHSAARRRRSPRQPRSDSDRREDRCQRGPRTSTYKYVRRVRGGRFQARVYQRNLASGHAEWLNLGLYSSEWDAWRAVREFVQTGRRPAHLLPKFIRRTAEGKYIGVVRLSGCKPIAIDPRETPEDANAALRAKIWQMFGTAGLRRFYPFG